MGHFIIFVSQVHLGEGIHGIKWNQSVVALVLQNELFIGITVVQYTVKVNKYFINPWVVVLAKKKNLFLRRERKFLAEYYSGLWLHHPQCVLCRLLSEEQLCVLWRAYHYSQYSRKRSSVNKLPSGGWMVSLKNDDLLGPVGRLSTQHNRIRVVSLSFVCLF